MSSIENNPSTPIAFNSVATSTSRIAGNPSHNHLMYQDIDDFESLIHNKAKGTSQNAHSLKTATSPSQKSYNPRNLWGGNSPLVTSTLKTSLAPQQSLDADKQILKSEEKAISQGDTLFADNQQPATLAKILDKAAKKVGITPTYEASLQAAYDSIKQGSIHTG